MKQISGVIRAIILFLSFMLMVGCGELEESADLPPEIEASSVEHSDFHNALTNLVQEIMDEEGVPGAAVAVVRGDTILFAEGFGYRDVEEELPVTVETLFHIASTNKSMTAMMIGTLVDQGKFAWDTPVVDIFPDFKLSSPESTQMVTMRHLLSMQSGISSDAEDEFDVDNATGEDVFTYMRDVPLLGMPGEQFSYSNISYSLAGYLGVISADYDQPTLYDGYERLFRERVLEPIGMKTAVLNASEAEKNPNYGKSYLLDDDGEAVEASKEDYDNDPLAPSGVLKANVVEMSSYISTQLNRGQAPNGVRVISAENLMEMWKPGLENYGMGWEITEDDGMTHISHDGSYDNYSSIIGFVPDLNIGYVVLTNSDEAGEELLDQLPKFIIDQSR